MQEKAELRARLAKALRSRDTDNLWTYLEEERYVQEVLDGELIFDDFVKTARRIKRAGQPTRTAATASPAGPPPGQARSWALSMLVATSAELEEAVTRFRKEVLGGATLSRADVEAWVENHPETRLPMSRDITITVEDGDVEYDSAGWIRLTAGTHRYRLAKTAVRVLDYAGAKGDWVLRVGVRAHGELDRLRRISELLARRYRWQPAQATLFVLTGAVPLIAQIRTTTSMFSAGPWADHVVLDVDPAESPDAVAAAFIDAVRGNQRAHTRPVREKHARLAVHALVECAAQPWKERTARWNASHPEWTYSEANYRRDALDARNRLLRTHDVGARGSAPTATE